MLGVHRGLGIHTAIPMDVPKRENYAPSMVRHGPMGTSRRKTRPLGLSVEKRIDEAEVTSFEARYYRFPNTVRVPVAGRSARSLNTS